MNRRTFLSALALGTGTLIGGMSGLRAGLTQPRFSEPHSPDIDRIEATSLPKTTALVFHPSYLLYVGPAVGSVQEGPNRLEAIMDRIRRTEGLKDLPLYLPSPATADQLGRAHDADYVTFIKGHDVLPQNERAFLRTFDAETKKAGIQFLPRAHTRPSLIKPYPAAALSAGGAIMAVDLVMSGQAPQAFALLRPPGHHAKANGYRGFCIFNNAAVAARHAQAAHGAKRIMIIDWDVHHGNGTQNIFYSDPDVLYFSVHQAGIYPRSGHVHEVGSGRGRGRTINVPLTGGMGDLGYRTVFQTVVGPVARAFKPDLIIVSAGQDAHAGERLAHMRLTDQGYATMAKLVQGMADDVCDGKLVLLLEGGYNPETAASSVCAVLQELRGAPPQVLTSPPDPTPVRQLRRQLANVVATQRAYWPQLAAGERHP